LVIFAPPVDGAWLVLLSFSQEKAPVQRRPACRTCSGGPPFGRSAFPSVSGVEVRDALPEDSLKLD
jgi:hypothetical protein